MLDGAHNPQGAAMLRDEVLSIFPDRRVTLLCGILAKKDCRAMVDIFSQLSARVITTRPDDYGAMDPAELAAMFEGKVHETLIIPDTYDALAAALAEAQDGPVIIAGSLYLVGKARTWLRENL